MSKKHKAKKKYIGKVNPVLYATIYALLKGKFTNKYNIHFDKDIVKDIKGPAIIVATHTSDADHILSALTFYPIRPTYVVSEHFLHNPSTARLLKYMHVISKKMFTTDVSTVLNIMRAKRENAVIVIFPEGRLSCTTRTLPLSEGTAELIKKLGVNLYAWKAEGAGLTFPKWRDKGDDRIGKINASVRLLLTQDEVAEKSLEEIRKITAEAIFNDDEIAMEGVEFKSETIAQGADRILFKCPVCLKEGGITAEGRHIRCECGLDATLNSCYRLEGAPFERLNEWFAWQQNSIDVQNEKMYSKVRLGCCKEDGYMDSHAGEGEVYMDKDIFTLKGVMHGEEIDFSISTERLGAFPITPGVHFDIYHDDRLIYIYPQPDERMSAKWVSFLDKLLEDRKITHL